MAFAALEVALLKGLRVVGHYVVSERFQRDERPIAFDSGAVGMGGQKRSEP